VDLLYNVIFTFFVYHYFVKGFGSAIMTVGLRKKQEAYSTDAVGLMLLPWLSLIKDP